MVAKSISHVDTVVEAMICRYLRGNEQKPGSLRWCRILSIHSRSSSREVRLGPPVVPFYPFLGEGSLLLKWTTAKRVALF